MKILKTLRRLVTPGVSKSAKPEPRFHVLTRPEPAPKRDENLEAAMLALHTLGTERGHALADEIRRGEERRQGRL